MPTMPTRPSGASSGCAVIQVHGVLDHVGRVRRDAIPLQIGQRHRHDAHAGAGEILRQRRQSRLLDPHRMDAGNQQHGAS